MTALPAPGLTIRQKFAPTAVATAQSLNAFLVGPNAYCSRYTIASEKSGSLLGAYDEVGTLVDGQMQTLFNWPGRPAGASVDLDFTRLFCDKALLRYFKNTTHTAVRVTGYRNRIRLSSAVFATGGGGTTNVGDRGVKVGDLIYVSGTDTDDAAFSLSSSIIDLIGDTVAASVGSVAAATSNAPAAASASATVTAGSSNSGSVTATASAVSYTGLESGRTTETYTITVTTGGAAATAKLRVVSASGTDDQINVTPEDLSSPTSIGTRGLTVTFAEGSSTNFTLGDTYTIAVQQLVDEPTVTISGTYVGTVDRTYILEIVQGSTIGGGAKVRVTSQDGGDTNPAIMLSLGSGTTSESFSFGSYGLTATIDSSSGLVLGDKWTVSVTAASEGVIRTLVLAHDLPSNVADDTTAALELELFIQDDIEIPAQSETEGEYNWTAEATQIRVAAGIAVTHPDWTVSGELVAIDLVHRGGFGSVSQLYAHYRAWYTRSTSILGVAPSDDLDEIMLGPTDPDNPLKYALSLARGAAAGETVYCYNTSDPSVTANWSAALALAGRVKTTYGIVPLTLDADILTLFNTHVQAFGGGERKNFYRVLWVGSENLEGGVVVSAATSDDDAVVLATTEDNPSASGTQYTLLRISSGNADLLTLGVRPGDEVRYFYEVDAWGNESYTSRTVDSVLSATTLLVTTTFGSLEAVAKRVEIHRTYAAGDLVDLYSDAAGAWSSDLVRYVVAPQAVIGSYTVPSYFVTALLAGLRSSNIPQQSLSRKTLSGVSNILGLDLLSSDNMDVMAGAGCAIVYHDDEENDVRVRHMLTTDSSGNLVRREESCVACRHIALFSLVTRLKPYVSNINLSTNLEDVQGMIFSELSSLKKDLQALYFTDALGGVIVDMTDITITTTPGLEDTLSVGFTMEIGKPGNNIDCGVLIV